MTKWFLRPATLASSFLIASVIPSNYCNSSRFRQNLSTVLVTLSQFSLPPELRQPSPTWYMLYSTMHPFSFSVLLSLTYADSARVGFYVIHWVYSFTRGFALLPWRPRRVCQEHHRAGSFSRQLTQVVFKWKSPGTFCLVFHYSSFSSRTYFLFFRAHLYFMADLLQDLYFSLPDLLLSRSSST